ncbi:hypothetical protein [Streptomyces sp. NPDC013489]|uniref:hypothetical protein n=1 Tax=Streptomyces sp. NPDC013489 TaxID=3155606 RepID=UPI0033CDACA9
MNVVEWATANGGQILFDQLDAAKVKECLASRDVDDCLWALVDIPSASVIVGRVPALALAIEKVSDGMRKIFNEADDALRRLNELTAVLKSVRGTPRLERCLAGVALHAGGAKTKAVAIQGLSGTNAQLHEVIGDLSWLQLMALGQATSQDKAAAYAYADAIAARKAILEDANRPYAMSSFDDGITLHAPQFGAEVMAFTHASQPKLSTRLGWDGHTNPSAESLAKAREVTEQNRGKDDWHDFAADSLLRSASTTNNQFFGGTTSTDIATYLRHGGFPAKKVTEGSAAFRVEVENLKQAWATCNHGDPVDPRNALSEVVSQASAEWEAEYAGQNTQRTLIMRAEADAAAATKAATDNMIEAIGQAWLADQILRWQKYWHDQLARDPDHILKPKQALFDQAKSDLEKARGKVRTLVTTAQEQAGLATAAAQRAVTAQQDAWVLADAAEVPRGRGLMYAQQSVQVARASGAAATAAAKATETALNAANATVSTSHTLLALAQTQTHAVNTEFRRIAAQEAAAQAKAAADSADRHAAEAEANLKIAQEAKATAEREEQEARQAAATAQTKRAEAELERANAAAHRATAERERDKASAAEARAQEEKGKAAAARGEATTAADGAAVKRADAEASEERARLARDRAVEAERTKRAADSRAAALEAAAAAAEGTEAATETRQLATEARAAANTANTAAVDARTAANEATTAAVASRAAATRAKGAADRSKAAADGAWAAYATAMGSAAAAHAAAATAIDASEAAAQNARNAEAESRKASAASAVAKQESAAAHSEAVLTAQWAAKTAGYAYATATAASAARDTATQAVKPAKEAIAIGTPYQEADASAGFAVLTGQSALTLSEQQAKAAEAKASQAAAYAVEAQRLAEQAAADDKLAAQAAAAAAKDAERAAKAVKRAQTAAVEAEKAAKAAQAAAKRADGYALQAGADALAATSAANEAMGDAVAADSAATVAEKDASSARAAATSAENDAATARSAATRAESDADAAETAAANAHTLAKEADEAAKRAEEEERKRLLEQRADHVDDGSLVVGQGLTPELESLLMQMCGQKCVDDYKAARDLAGGDIVEWVKANGGAILLELFGLANIKECLSTWDFEACVWALVDVAGYLVPVLKIPAVAKALYRIGMALDKFFDASKLAKKLMEKYQGFLNAVRKSPVCLIPSKSGASKTTSYGSGATGEALYRGPSYGRSSFSSIASGGDDFGWPEDWKPDPAPEPVDPKDFFPEGWDDAAGEIIDQGGWASIPGLCPKSNVKIDSWFTKKIKSYHFEGGKDLTDDRGRWNNVLSEPDLVTIFLMAEFKCGAGDWEVSKAVVNNRVCVFNPGLGVVGKTKKDGPDTHWVEVVVSIYGVPVTMYPVPKEKKEANKQANKQE